MDDAGKAGAEVPRSVAEKPSLQQCPFYGFGRTTVVLLDLDHTDKSFVVASRDASGSENRPVKNDFDLSFRRSAGLLSSAGSIGFAGGRRDRTGCLPRISD